MKLTDNLYAYVWEGSDNNCNSFLFGNVLAGNKHILIDPGHIETPYFHEHGYETLTQSIRQDGLKLEDIGMVVLTHAHSDHIESARNFKNIYHSILALNKEDEPMYLAFAKEKIDLYLKEGELKLDNLVREKLEIYHVPGHASGHIALYWPAKKALAAGDVIFYRNIGRVDLPGSRPAKLKTSLEKLSRLDVEYLLCGHPYEHPGVIQGKAAVKANFDFVISNIWF